MKEKDQNEIRELRDKIIKLETLLEVEFKHMKDDWKEVCTSIKNLNEEYGRLLEKFHNLEISGERAKGDLKRSLIYWKIAASIGAPVVTTLVICVVRLGLGLGV